MTIAFVIGNGISRRGIPLNDLKQVGKVYACNAIYRDFIPDVLVATDKVIATHIQESGYSSKNCFYTRKPIEGLGALKLSKEYQGYSSGPNALALSAIAGATKIYMIGFDMGPTKNQTFNNIYAGTEFYKSTTALPTFTGNWVRQICKICNDFLDKRFIRIYGKETARIQELDALSNMKHEDLSVFLNRINNQKDF